MLRLPYLKNTESSAMSYGEVFIIALCIVTAVAFVKEISLFVCYAIKVVISCIMFVVAWFAWGCREVLLWLRKIMG